MGRRKSEGLEFDLPDIAIEASLQVDRISHICALHVIGYKISQRFSFLLYRTKEVEESVYMFG